MKKNATFLLSCLLIISCATSNEQDLKKFKTLSIPDLLDPSSPPSNFDLSKIGKPDQDSQTSNLIKEKILEENTKKGSFDYLPPDGYEFQEGVITVIFKNNDYIRVNKEDNKIYSKSKTDLSILISSLKQNGLSDYSDLGNYSKEDDNKLDEMQKEYFEKNKTDIPHLRSIHYYKVDKKADTHKLCKDLMKLPYVRLAYPTPKFKVAHEFLINSVPYSTTVSNSTPDFNTDTYYPNNYLNYYWFHEHDIFRAKDYYRGQPEPKPAKPTIAVIDKGFDPNSPELDILPGYKITDPWWWSLTVTSGSGCPSNNCITSSDNISHGNGVAYVAAAKNNNNINPNSYGEGVAEGAKILPFNLIDLTSESINVAISYAQSNSAVDAINISIGSGNNPITFDASVNTAISYAVQSYNKPVVVAAGNGAQALNPPDGYSSDAIVVGGTMPMNPLSNINYNKYKRWYTNSSEGSNYFNVSSTKQNPIDLAAAAHQIYFLNYNGNNNTRNSQYQNGTSFASPMVAATVAMMKKINPSLNARKIKNIVTFSSNLREFDASSSYNYVIGKNLDYTLLNNSYKVGIRDLNTYRALFLAKNISDPNYVALARVFNNDDAGLIDQATTSLSFPGYSYTAWGDDNIWGFTPAGGNFINYANYNDTGECTYGFQVYSNNHTDYALEGEGIGGIASSVGITCNQNSWTNHMYYLIN